MNLEEQRNYDNIIRLAEQKKDPEGPLYDENMEESTDEFEHQKKSLAGFLNRVSTWIRNANARVEDKRVHDLQSVRKELDVAWERYDSLYENYIAKNLLEGELDGVKDRYTEIVVQYEECTIRINDCLTQMKKTSTKGKSARSEPSSKRSRLKDLSRDIEMKKLKLEQEQELAQFELDMERKKIELEFEKKKRACELKSQI